MSKTYDIPEVEVFIEGGQVQYVKIPKDNNIKVIIRDYDVEDVDLAKKEGFTIEKDLDGEYYEKSVWEN